MKQDADMQYEHGDGWSACSARGLQRDKNSDALAVSAAGPCLGFVVADGVGPLAMSPVASRVAAAAAAAWVTGRASVGIDDMGSLASSVNEAVRTALEGSGEPQGATTLAFAAIDGGRGVVATVGDSEALAIGDEGPAERLNELDHVPARPNILLAWIDGTNAFEPHVIALDPLPRRLCLVTDGIIKVLDYERIASLVRGAPADEAARTLVLTAQGRGAADDVTALVVSRDVMRSVA